MKKKIFIIGFLLLFCDVYSQSGWFRVTDSIPNLYIMAIQFTSENIGYAVGSYDGICPGGVLRTTNGGLNWQFTNFPLYSADDLSFLNDNTGYISSWSIFTGRSYVLKTTNSGVNWIIKDSLNASFFNMKFYDLNTGIVASKYSTVHKTTNGGSNWFAQTGVIWHGPSCIWCFDANNWLVADRGTSLNKTTNGGENWSVLDFSSSGFDFKSLYFINSNTGFGLSGLGSIYKTSNKGNNWVKIDSISSFYGYRGNIFFVNDYTGFVCGSGYEGNIYKTTNGGLNWISKSNHFPDLMTYIFFVNPNTGYVGSKNGFIYKTTTGGNVFVGNISNEIPKEYKLFQNFPNPFNPTTKIRFAIREEGKGKREKTKLDIFDILGKEITTLVNETLQPGMYEVTFDGKNLPSGIYFYELTAGDFVSVRKMLLIK